MDSVHFYQYPNKTGRPGKWRSAASNFEIRKARDNAMTYGPSSSKSGRLEDYDLVKYFDLTASPPEDSFHPYLAPVLDPRSAEWHAGGPSNTVDTEGGHESDGTVPSLEKLLFGAGEVQESQRAGSSVEHGIGRSDRTFERPTQNDCDNASTSGPRQGGDRGGDIDGSSSIHPRSNGSTSVAGSEAGCSILHEKTEDPISDPPPPPPDTLSSTHDTQICFKNIEPHHPGGGKEKADKGDGDKGDEWEEKKAETEAYDEGEKTDGDDKHKTPLLPYTMQSCRSVAGERPSSQRRNRPRRCLPPHRSEAGNQGTPFTVQGYSGDAENDSTSAASCSTDNIIPYSLRSPIASPTPDSPLVSWRSPLREDAVGPAADQAGSLWIWSPARLTDAEPVTATGATDIRDSSKRTADSAGLNEGGEGVHRLGKARRADPIVIDEKDDTVDDLSDLDFTRIRSQPKPVFRRPPSPRNFQQREKTTSSSQSNEIGDSQGNPLVVEDDEEKTGETGGSTSMESEISTIHLESSHPREQPKTHGCLSPPTTIEPTTDPTTSPFDRPISPSVALSRDPVEQAILEVIAEQQQPSIPLTPLPSPHLFPSNLRTKEV